MTESQIKQAEFPTKLVFIEKLIHLRDLHKRKQYDLAAKLGITQSYLSELLKGREPGSQVVAAVNLLFQETFSLKLKPQEGVVLKSENAKQLLDEFTSRLGIQPIEFVEQMLLRYGQKTFEELEQRKLEVNSRQTVSELAEKIKATGLEKARQGSAKPK